MDEENARDLVKKILVVSGQINEMIESTNQLKDDQERRFYIRKIAEMMDVLFFGIMGPIIKEYPDLDPDKEYFEDSDSR